MSQNSAPLLDVSGLVAGYGRKEVLHGVGLRVEAGEIGVGNFREFRRGESLGVRLGARDLAHECDEILLHGFEERARGGVGGVALGGTEGDVELVERADGLDLRMILRHALAVEQAGRAVVTGARGDGAGHRFSDRKPGNQEAIYA